MSDVLDSAGDPPILIVAPQLKVSMRIAQMEFSGEGENDAVFKAFGYYLATVKAAIEAGNAAVDALRARGGEQTH